jgi:hypothetical protein
MTKFLQYLNESRTQPVSEEQANELIDKHCSKNYKKLESNKFGIYRGTMEPFGDYGYINTNKGELRTSANTENYTTLLMDNLPSWKSYPKRSRGIICSTDKNSAEQYGEAYHVIPYDNAKIGICSKEDVWYSFDFTPSGNTYDVPDLNQLFKITFYRYNIKVDDSNWSSFKSGLNKLDLNTVLEDKHYEEFMDGWWEKLRNYIFETDKKIIQHLDNILNPTKHGFLKGFDKISKKDRELWIQGEAIFIKDNQRK